MPSPNSGQRNKVFIRQVHLASACLTMREHVIRAGFAWEIDWQDSRSLSRLTESEFLGECLGSPVFRNERERSQALL